MNIPQQLKLQHHVLLNIALLVVILAGIHAATEIVVPFLLACFLTIVLNPLVVFLMRYGLGRGLAITAVMLMVLLTLTLLVMTLASSADEFTQLYPQMRTMLEQRLELIQHLANRIHITISASSLAARLDPDVLVNFVTSLLTKFSGAVAHFVLLLLTVIFMLAEVRHLPYKLRKGLANPQLRIAGLHKALRGVTHYLALKTLISLMTAIAVWLSLLLLGVKFALLWGMVALILNFIPAIGPIIAGIPPLIQALLLNTLYDAALVAGMFTAIHLLLGNILEPRLLGRGLGMSTLVIFLSLIFWGWLLGPVGTLLSVPLTSVCKILLENSTSGGKLAVLLGNGRIGKIQRLFGQNVPS